MTAQESAQDVFARATLVTDGQVYRLLRLPPAAITPAAGVLAEIGTPFSALLADDQEVTLLVPQEEWEAFETRLPDIDEGGLYRLITFDAALDPTLTGFLARVTEVLAAAGVPILALSAFSRDHIFVPADAFDTAWAVLRAAQQSGERRIVSEPINFFLNSDNLKPRSEVRIEKLDAQPLPDGRRVKVQLDVTPFREKPSFEIAILDAAGARVGGTTVIEAMTFRLELTLHLRGVAQPEGDYTLHVALYYEDPAEPQDQAQTTVTIPAPAE